MAVYQKDALWTRHPALENFDRIMVALRQFKDPFLATPTLLPYQVAEIGIFLVTGRWFYANTKHPYLWNSEEFQHAFTDPSVTADRIAQVLETSTILKGLM